MEIESKRDEEEEEARRVAANKNPEGVTDQMGLLRIQAFTTKYQFSFMQIFQKTLPPYPD